MVAPITVSPAALVTGIAGADEHDVAGGDVFDGDLYLGVVADHGGGAGLQADQFPDRFAGAGLCADLEEATQQDQGDDDSDRFEVHLAHICGHQ